MATKNGQVTLRGRFPVGAVVRLVKVSGEHVLRPEGGEEIEVKTVSEEKDAPRVGYVRFSNGVEAGCRYFVSGLVDGVPLDVRIRGREAGDESEVLEQAPIQRDRQRLADGSWVDEAPSKESAPQILAAHADQRHVPKGTVQRSDTPRGEAHPVDPKEKTPKRSQDDVGKGAVQMSDTRPREVDGVTFGGGGEATELVLGPQRQEDVPKGVVQRSDTPTGVAQPIPAGDAVKQAQDRESSFAKETRGDWTRGGAEPIESKGTKVGAPKGSNQKDSEERDAELKKSEREAAVAPPIEDVAPSAGQDQSAEDLDDAAKRKKAASRKRSKAAKKKAPSKRNEKKDESPSKKEQEDSRAREAARVQQEQARRSQSTKAKE